MSYSNFSQEGNLSEMVIHIKNIRVLFKKFIHTFMFAGDTVQAYFIYIKFLHKGQI